MLEVHLKDDVLANLEENNISHVLILGGCTSKIQPLDVCLNKTFTAYIRGVCEEYKAGQAQSTHIASQIPTASRKDILGRIVAANQCLNFQRYGKILSWFVAFSMILMGVKTNSYESLGPEKGKDKFKSDPFVTSEDTDQEECDGEDSE